jgi:hypothetical protein
LAAPLRPIKPLASSCALVTVAKTVGVSSNTPLWLVSEPPQAASSAAVPTAVSRNFIEIMESLLLVLKRTVVLFLILNLMTFL